MIELAWLLAGVALVAAVMACVGAGLAARSGPSQAPLARSSHDTPTPISGGLGVALGVGVAITLLAASRPEAFASTVTHFELARLSHVVLFAFAFAALGAADDVFDLGPRLKLFLFGLGSALLALAAGPVTAFPITADIVVPLPQPLAVAGTALWVLTVVNAVNFMDGANGLVGGSSVLAGTGLAIVAVLFGAPEAAVLGAALAGGFAGFLPWNTPRARVFMGDAGSLFAGAMLVGGGLLMAREAPPGATYVAAVLIVPLLVDVLLTLAWRQRRGQPLMRAHNDHAYQRRLLTGAGELQARHQRVSQGMWLRMGVAVVAAIAAAAHLRAGGGAWAAIAVLGAAALLEAGLWRLAPPPAASADQ